MPPPPPSSAGTEGSILLVEEYDALSAAIASALKKFALGRPILTASSLAAAERVIEEENLTLLLVDFDPPLAGALAFFNRLRTVCPETRVLIMASGLPVEVLLHRRSPVALHFMGKPFQLAEFGHAISSLLGGAPLAAGYVAPGRAGDMSVVDVALLHALAGATESVRINIPGDERTGEIHFEKGNIRHAQASGLVGIDALRELVRWSKPNFTAVLRETAMPQTIEGNWTAVLLQILRSIPLPPTPRGRPAAAAEDARTILVIDDTETLREFVEEMLTTSDPNLRIETAATGTEGVQRCLALQPDLLLLDYSLPDIDGDEVCRRLSADENASRIPIIMMSGHVAQMAMTAAQYPNIVATLSKPFVSAVLIDAVTKVLYQGSIPKRRKPAAESALAAAISTAPRHGQTAKNGHAVTPPLAPPVSSPPVPADSETVSTPHRESTALPIPEEVLLKPEPPSPAQPAPLLTPARIPVARHDVVVLSLPLEVVAMQFSPALRPRAIRARPPSHAVSLHVDPRASQSPRIPEVAFEIAHIDLDASGQMQFVRLVPAQARPILPGPHPIALDQFTVAPQPHDDAIHLAPAAGSHLLVRLLVAFDLAGVELSPAFGVSHLGLRARGGRVRVILPGSGGKMGVTFESAQVLLDRTARVAEVLLDSVVDDLTAAVATPLGP